MPRRALTFALTTIIAGTFVMAGIAAIAIHHLTTIKESRTDALCPTLTVQSETPGVHGIIQAAIRADRDYPLYSYDGVSEIPRPAGTLGKGEQFCFRADTLAISLSADDHAGDAVPIGLIETANWSRGVYSPVVNTIPTITRDDGDHRVVLTHWLSSARLDGEPPLDFMYPPFLGEESGVVSPLSEDEVSALMP